MAHGASVVSANKALLAEAGPSLYAAAAQHGVDLYYEAAVAGAIPILRPIRESLAGDDVRKVLGAAEAAATTDPDVVREAVDVGPRKTVRILTLLDRDRELGVEGDPVTAVVARAERQRELDRSRVDMVREYVETERCRMDFLAVYFGEDGRVTQIANYGLKDGRVFDFISRTTPAGGSDQNFVGQLFRGLGTFIPNT